MDFKLINQNQLKCFVRSEIEETMQEIISDNRLIWQRLIEHEEKIKLLRGRK